MSKTAGMVAFATTSAAVRKQETSPVQGFQQNYGLRSYKPYFLPGNVVDMELLQVGTCLALLIQE